MEALENRQSDQKIQMSLGEGEGRKKRPTRPYLFVC